MLDNPELVAFRQSAQSNSTGYQTLINAALRQSLANEVVTEKTTRRVLREEIVRYK